MLIRITAAFILLVIATSALVFLLGWLNAGPSISVAALGLFSSIAGGVGGYFSNRLPRSPSRRSSNR
jgi:hypothetical protein